MDFLKQFRNQLDPVSEHARMLNNGEVQFTGGSSLYPYAEVTEVMHLIRPMGLDHQWKGIHQFPLIYAKPISSNSSKPVQYDGKKFFLTDSAKADGWEEYLPTCDKDEREDYLAWWEENKFLPAANRLPFPDELLSKRAKEIMSGARTQKKWVSPSQKRKALAKTLKVPV